MKVVLITAQNNDFDKNLASVFAREGYKTYVMGNVVSEGLLAVPTDIKEAADVIQKDSGCIDIYIDVTNEKSTSDDFNVRTGINERVIFDLYEANVKRPMALLEAFLPLLEKGNGKRLCYITSAEASINETRDVNGLGYKMAKAALHNFLQITRNALAPKGYTIRAFDPCLADFSGGSGISAPLAATLSATAAFNYFTRRRGMERDDPNRDDEGNLVLRDACGRQHSW
ncbi:Rossmann-fold NAD(P)-binding domain-containing protein [Treponema sp. R6D11]